MTGQITKTKRILEDKGITDERIQSLLKIFQCQNKYSGITVHTKNMFALEESQSKKSQKFNKSKEIKLITN